MADSIPVHWQSATFEAGGRVISYFHPSASWAWAMVSGGEASAAFWTRLWPSAAALTRFVLENPDWVEGEEVVELAAGLGLPSLAAACHAREVLCTDLHAEAMACAEASARWNGLNNFRTAAIDWNDFPEHLAATVMLASDIHYDPASFAALRKLFIKWLAGGRTIILSSPHRLAGRDFLLPLLPMIVQREEYTLSPDGQPSPVSVMVLRRRDGGGMNY